MKTIKIFFASSEELEDDRNAFGNLIRRLSKVYEKRGVKLELFEWEDYDAAYNNCRKQNEYNEQVRASDMFLAAFHTKAGKFTIEEFNVAVEEFKKKESPKIYVYCKDLKEGESENGLLKEFKERLINDMGHFWCRYSNRDTLNLNFVLQLQLVEGNMSEVRVDDGEILLEDEHIACIDKLPFASQNEEFNKMSIRMKELPLKIEKVRSKVEKYPDDEDFVNELQLLQNEYNELKKDFAEHQCLLFDTAKHIAKLQGKRITERMLRAVNAFNEGRIRDANIILKEVEIDAKVALEDYRQSKELTELKRKNVVTSIEELLLKASTLIVDKSLSIEVRVSNVEELYEEVDKMSIEISYEDYEVFLLKYAHFLSKYTRYNKALEINKRLIKLLTKSAEPNSKFISYINRRIAMIYDELGNYQEALQYYFKALNITECLFGLKHEDTANLYQSIGLVYQHLSDYSKALDYYKKSLCVNQKIFGNGHMNTLMSYVDVGNAYEMLGIEEYAQEYMQKALEIYEQNVIDNQNIAILRSVSSVYRTLKCFDKELECRNKILQIQTEELGLKHPSTADSYGVLGFCYQSVGDYVKAIECHHKAMRIFEDVFGLYHLSTAIQYDAIGSIYESLHDYNNALHYRNQGLKIFEHIYGVDNIETLQSYCIIGSIYMNLCIPNKALEYYHKAVARCTNSSYVHSLISILSHNRIGDIYSSQKKYAKALKHYLKALKHTEEIDGVYSSSIISVHLDIANTYVSMKDFHKALEYYNKVLEINIQINGENNISTMRAYIYIANMYMLTHNKEKALEYYNKVIESNTNEIDANYMRVIADAHMYIGLTYSSLNDYKSALVHYCKAEEVIRTYVMCGDDCKDADLLSNIGFTYYYLEDYTKAQEYLTKVLDIQTAMQGIDNSQTQKISNMINEINVKQSQINH